MRQGIRSSLLRVMACYPLGTKPLFEAMTTLLTLRINLMEIRITLRSPLFEIIHVEMSSAKCRTFCIGLNGLTRTRQRGLIRDV